MKKVYLLYSLAGELKPKIYKSKSTIQKHLSKNKSLSYYEFPNEQQANVYLSTLQQKNASRPKKAKSTERGSQLQKEAKPIPSTQRSQPKPTSTSQRVQINPNELALKLMSIDDKDATSFIQQCRRFHPFRSPTLMKVDQQNLSVDLKFSRKQNPGFTVGSYSIKNNRHTIYRRDFKLGVTRNSQAMLLTVGQVLIDIMHSSARSTLFRISIDRLLLERSEKSLDGRIKDVAASINKLRGQGFATV